MMTDKAIRSAISGVASGGKPRAELKDDGPRGGGRLTLSIRKSAAGATSEWYAVWHRNTEKHSTKIGTYPGVSLFKARDLFRVNYQPDILSGKNPQGPRSWTKGIDPTISDMFEAYATHLEAQGKVSAARVRGILLGSKGVANGIGPSRRSADVVADDIVPHLAEIHDRGSIVLADNVRGFIRAAFQFALSNRHSYHTGSAGVDWGIKSNPVDAIPSNPAAKRARDRVLSNVELRALWDWCKSMEWQLRYRSCYALRLVIATGQRPTEILRIATSGYDPKDGSLYWSTTKNKRPHLIPIPRQAKEILESLQPNEHGLYFWRKTYPDQPIGFNGFAQILERYFKDTKAAHFEVRDLRRTWKTLSGKAGISKEIRDRIQNHALSDVASKHYDRYDYWAEKVAAMTRWEAILDYILSAEGPISVNEMRSLIPLLAAPAPSHADVTDEEDVIDAEFELIE
jgi:integrase